MNNFWPDVIFSGICLTILEVAVTGKLRSAGRGGGRHVMATVSSPWARIAFAIVGWCLLAWILIDVSRKLLAA
jgi:hypothetical protein